MGGASISSLVKVNKNPQNPNSQRAGLLPLLSPSLSCQCPGSLQPLLCVPKHPLPWSQHRTSAEMSRGSLEEGKLRVQSGTFGKQQFLFRTPLLACGWKQPSLSKVNLCLPPMGMAPKHCNPDPDWGVDPFGSSPMAPCELWGRLTALGAQAPEPPMISALCSSKRGEGSKDTQFLWWEACTALRVLKEGKDSCWPLFLGEIGSLLLLWRLLVWVRAEPRPVSLSKYASSIWLNELWLLINGSYLAEVLLNCQDLKLA